MHRLVRLANLLGATALTTSEIMLADVREAAGVSASGAAALMVLTGSSPIGGSELGRRIGLSQSATARLVDSMERAGLVRRHARSGRDVIIEPTSAATKVVDAVMAAREQALSPLVAGLSREEQVALDTALSKVLCGLHARVGSADQLCRLCDRAGCVRTDVCPVGQAERAAGP